MRSTFYAHVLEYVCFLKGVKICSANKGFLFLKKIMALALALSSHGFASSIEDAQEMIDEMGAERAEDLLFVLTNGIAVDEGNDSEESTAALVRKIQEQLHNGGGTWI
jgi:hypothetical protein